MGIFFEPGLEHVEDVDSGILVPVPHQYAIGLAGRTWPDTMTFVLDDVAIFVLDLHGSLMAPAADLSGVSFVDGHDSTLDARSFEGEYDPPKHVFCRHRLFALAGVRTGAVSIFKDGGQVLRSDRFGRRYTPVR